MNNIFVLSAGRVASTTFANACKHITNFSSAHESRAGMLGADRLDFPAAHIEIDNRLVWFLAQLQSRFASDVGYVYLTRDKEEIARSYVQRWHLNESIVRAYGHGLLMKPHIKKSERLGICRDYVESTDFMIKHFLQDKPNKLFIDVKQLSDEFEMFFNWIGAKGDLASCISELSIYSNKNKSGLINKLWRLLK